MPGPQKQNGAAMVGLGNILLTDDGVGVHAVRKLREDPPEGVILAEVGTTVLDALDLFESVRWVLAIDAVRVGGSPGSIYTFDIDEVETRKGASLHEFGITAAMQSLPVESTPHVTILGIEPAVIGYGMELSSVVQAVLPEVAQTACAMASQWMRRVQEQQESNCDKI